MGPGASRSSTGSRHPAKGMVVKRTMSRMERTIRMLEPPWRPISTPWEMIWRMVTIPGNVSD